MLSHEEALERMLCRVVFQVATETVPLRSALGRITAKDIYARFTLPVSNIATKDGVAVKSVELGTDITDTQDWQPGVHLVAAGMGSALPEGFDTLILAEKVRFLDNGKLEILEMPRPKQNVSASRRQSCRRGEGCSGLLQTDANSPGNAYALAGITDVEVLKKPKVAILPTGNRLVPLGIRPGIGQNVESNGIFIEASLQQWGAESQLYPIIRDDPDDLQRGSRLL